jgi:hypothetical protein
LRLCRIEAEVFQRFKPCTGTLASFMASTKRKNQLFFSTSAPFKASEAPSSNGIKLEAASKACAGSLFGFAVAVHHYHLVTMRNDQFTFVFSPVSNPL